MLYPGVNLGVGVSPGCGNFPQSIAPAGASYIWNVKYGIKFDSSGNVQNWVDVIQGAVLSQSSSSLRPTYTQLNPAFKGAPTINTPGTQYLSMASLGITQPDTICIIWKANARATNTPVPFDSFTSSVNRQVIYPVANNPTDFFYMTANGGTNQIESVRSFTISDTLAIIGVYNSPNSSLVVKGITTNGNVGVGNQPDLRIFGSNSGTLLGNSSMHEIR